MDGTIGATSDALGLVLRGDAELWRLIGTSFAVSLGAIAITAPAAIAAGFALAHARFPGRRLAVAAVNAAMALPTIVIGIMLYLLLSRAGPLGELGLLFTRPAMVLGQALLAFPLLTAISHVAVRSADARAWETALTLGARPGRAVLTVLFEVRFGLMIAVIAGFARMISEVGCSMMIGGNVLNYTRSVSTAIMAETSRGDFGQAIALGIVLLAMGLVLCLALSLLQGRGELA